MIRCNDVFGRDKLRSYQEFYLAMAVGAECGRRGDCLDLSMMRMSDPQLLSKADKDYLKYLKAVGAVYDGSVPEVTFARGSDRDYEEDRPKMWFDVDKITELEGRLFEERDDGYHWSHDWAYKSYGNEYLTSVTGRSIIGSTIMHLAGYMLVSFMTGTLPPKKVYFHFNRMEVRSTYIYLPLYACINSCETVKKFIELVFDEERRELRDLDYYVLFDSCRNAGRFTWHSWQKKLDAMKKNGIKEGSLVIMYHKGRMSDNNRCGVILDAFVGRIESLKDAPNISIHCLSVNKTKEEQELDYLEIDESYRYMYSDMLNFSLPQTHAMYDLCSVGVCEYFYMEEWLMLPIGSFDVTPKRITINGVQTVKGLSDVEAIYWILNQFDYDFDTELYKAMYNEGKPLLWDQVDGTPCLITDAVDQE